MSGNNPDFDETGSSKSDDDGRVSPWKRDQFDHHRNWSAETASLTCSDSLNSSLTDDTDEETCSVSPDSSRRRYRRLSPQSRQNVDLPSSLTVIQDLSFDDYTSCEDKLHEPSTQKTCQNRRKRLLWVVPLAFLASVLCCSLRTKRSPRLPQPEEWKVFLHNDAPRIRRLIETSPVPDTFTVRLAGGRPDLIERSLDVLTRCSSVEEVQVEWQSILRAPKKLVRHASGKVARVEKLVTNAVLLLNEDVMFTCDELERAFTLWRLNTDRMVGFFPYQQSAPETFLAESLLQQPAKEYKMEPVQPGSGHYVLLSSRATFVHKEYLESFRSPGDIACRQFALSIHCTAISSKAPLAVAADPQEQRTSDLVTSLGQQHDTWMQEEVSSCLRQWIEGHELDFLPSEDSTYLGA